MTIIIMMTMRVAMTLRLKHSFYRDLCDHYLYHYHDDDEGNHKDDGNNDMMVRMRITMMAMIVVMRMTHWRGW